MKPHVTCLMMPLIDGRLHPGRHAASPDGTRDAWASAYERRHDEMAGDAWLIGRGTMAEMSQAAAHPPAAGPPVERPAISRPGRPAMPSQSTAEARRVHLAYGGQPAGRDAR